MSIIDDFSKNIWIYILKTKDEAFQKFKQWKKMVEVQTGKKVKHLRTDNGWEFFKRRIQEVLFGRRLDETHYS